MFPATSLLIAALAAVASAQTITGAFDCEPAGAFTLCQNLWGRMAGVGSQNSTLQSSSGNSVSWTTVWNWQNGPNNVKSYANVEHQTAKGMRLADISTLPSAWNWEYQTKSDGIRADVSYDIWTGVPQVGAPASTASSFEIMIWLSGLGGISPVGQQITTGTQVAGHSWNLWSGPNSNWHVFSFVSAAGDITDFSADLNEFFKYLVAEQGVSSSQFLQSIQSGTEPFTGSATLITKNFSVSVNTGPAPAPPVSSPASSTATATATATSTASAPVATQTHFGQCGGTGFTGPTVCATGLACKAISPPYYYQCL